MNTPKTISEILENFEEINRKCDGEYGTGKFPPEVKTFIRQSINEILDSIPLEEKEIKKPFDKQYDAFTKVYNIGYNEALKEIKH